MLVQRTIILSAIAAIPAWATQLGGTFSSAAALMAANSNQTFTNISFDPFNPSTIDPSLTIGPITFGGPGSSPLTVVSNPGGSWPAGSILRRTSGNPGQPINITLDSSIRAFGATFGLVQVAPPSGPQTITVSYTSDSNYSYSLVVSDLGSPIYLGFATDSAISNLSVSANFGFLYVALNDASYGVPNLSSTETPEVGTLLLIGTGLITVRLLHRRRMRTSVGKVSHAPTPETKLASTAVSRSRLRLSAEPC